MRVSIYADTLLDYYGNKVGKEHERSFNDFCYKAINFCDNEAEIEISDEDFQMWMDSVGMTMDYHLNESYLEDYDSLCSWLVTNGKPFRIAYCSIFEYIRKVGKDNLTDDEKKIADCLEKIKLTY